MDNLRTPAYNTRSKSIGSNLLEKEDVPPSEAETIPGPMGHSTHIEIHDESFTESEESENVSPNTHLTSVIQGIEDKVQSGDHEKRIVNGQAARSGEFPFMVAMYHDEVPDPFCGATILSSRVAITAAHCTYGDNSPITVVAGIHDLRRKLICVWEHEEYMESGQGLVNDIALLFLLTPLSFNAHVMPVCLPNTKLNIINQEAKIIGWGKTGLDEGTSSVLLKMVAKISQLNECRIFPLFQESSMICSNSLTSSACVGDSGGPMIWLDPEVNRYTLVGLVSYGYPPGCVINKPTVITDVSAHLPWIQARVQGYCHKV